MNIECKRGYRQLFRSFPGLLDLHRSFTRSLVIIMQIHASDRSIRKAILSACRLNTETSICRALLVTVVLQLKRQNYKSSRSYQNAQYVYKFILASKCFNLNCIYLTKFKQRLAYQYTWYLDAEKDLSGAGEAAIRFSFPCQSHTEKGTAKEWKSLNTCSETLSTCVCCPAYVCVCMY